MKHLTALLSMIVIVLLIRFDEVAAEHMLEYGWIFQGVVWTVIAVQAVIGYEALRALLKP